MTLPLVRNTGDMSAAPNSRASALPVDDQPLRPHGQVLRRSEHAAGTLAERLIRSQPGSSSPLAPAPSEAIIRRRVIRSVIGFSFGSR